MRNLNNKTAQFSEKISFIDAEGIKCRLDINLKDGRFSMSGSRAGSCGQILDDIKPKTPAQFELLYYWKKYHLNDMKPGTSKQMEALEKKGIKEYNKAVKYLKSINLYDIDGKKYGHAWYYKDLPPMFIFKLEQLVGKIRKEEEEKEKEEEEENKDRISKLMEEEGIDEDEREACEAFLEASNHKDLENFSDSYQGKFEDDVDFAKDLAFQIGDINKNMNWPHNCINWEEAAEQLMIDYFSQDGFYFRYI